MSNKNNLNTKQGVLPRLRFPEFQDAPNWDKKTLKTVATFFKGKGLPKRAIGSLGGNLCIHYGELFTKYSEVIRTVISNTDLNEGCFLSVENDVLMPTSDVTPKGLAKSCCLKLSNIILGGDILIIRPDQSLVCGEFLSRFIRKQKKQVLQVVSGSTVFHLYASNIKNLIFAFPDLSEQQKIADCLSSLDELIAGHARKLEALQSYKKGLMQNLFPAEGETTPKLRLSEFRNKADWEVKLLGELISYKNGKAHEQSISDRGQYIVVNSKFISTDGLVKKFSNESNCLAHTDDILMVLSDVPNGKAIAKCFLVDKDNTYTVNQRIGVIKPVKDVSRFFYYLINRNPFYLSFDDGVKQTNLRKDDVLSCPIILPPSEKEQIKIAGFITSIDNLINNQSKKIESLKAHKKGLMQQLFPSMELIES